MFYYIKCISGPGPPPAGSSWRQEPPLPPHRMARWRGWAPGSRTGGASTKHHFNVLPVTRTGFRCRSSCG